MHESISKQASVLITGGAGFIGTPLSLALVDAGHEVLVLDDLRANTHFAADSRINTVQKDLRDRRSIERIMSESKPDVVVHLAAIHFIPYCNEHPDETISINVEATRNLLKACDGFPPRKLFFASSAAVYAPSERPHRESDPLGPVDIYGLTKAFGEVLVRKFHHDHTDTVCTIGRFFNVYGPGDTNLHVIPEIATQVIDSLRDDADAISLSIGNLTTQRDYVYVDDVVAAILALLEIDRGCREFNIGVGRGTSVLELIKHFERVAGRRIEIEQSDERMRKVDRPLLVSDVSAIGSETGWRPRQTLTAGLSALLSAEAPTVGRR